LRKLTASLSKSKTVLIFINQIRMKIGVMFGNPEVTSGGNALKFYASLRLEIRKVTNIKKGDTVIGNLVRVKIAKNKFAPPFRNVEFDIEFGSGISRLGELIDFGAKCGVFEKSGSWYMYKGNNIAQGREKLKVLLEENTTLATEISASVKEQLKSKFLPNSTEESETIVDE